MKILLTSLPYFDNSYHVHKEMQSGIGYRSLRSGNLNAQKKIYPICDLLYTAALLRNNNFNLVVDDDQFLQSKNFNEYSDNLSKKCGVPDIVIVRTSLPTINSDLEIAQKLKLKWKKAKFFVYGPIFASKDILEFIKNKKFFDGIIVSEIESVIMDILKKNKNIPGYYFLKNKKYFIDNIETSYTEMNKLPPPAYEFVDYKKIDRFYIQTQRGCPVGCAYCPYYLSQKNKFRSKTPETVIKELKYLVEKFNAKTIAIHDPIISLDNKRLIEICNLIIKNKLNIKWECETHLAHVNNELLTLMKKAGCSFMSMGIESANQEVLSTVNRKFQKWDQAKKIIDFCKKVGIRTRGFFILGLPQDTIKGSFASIKLLQYLNLDAAKFNLPIPIPNTLPYYQGLDLGILSKKEMKENPDNFFEKLGAHHDGNDLSLSKKISDNQLQNIFKVANHYESMIKTENLIHRLSKYLKIIIYKFFIYFEEFTKKLKYN